MRTIIKTMLEDLGHEEIVEAGHGADAWKQLRSEPFDLLLTDWNMPVMNGLDLVTKVRQTPNLNDLPIIMATSRNNKADVITAVKAGVNTYIIKPFTRPQLKDRIDKMLQRSAGQVAKQLEPIVGGSKRLTLQDDSPLILFGENIPEIERLYRPEHKDVVHYLARAQLRGAQSRPHPPSR